MLKNIDETFLEKALICFEKENLVEGADYLLKAYYEFGKSKEILSYFDEVFFKPNLKELQRIYTLNSDNIKKYKNKEITIFEDLPYHVIPIDENYFYIYDKLSEDIVSGNFTEKQIEIIELCTNENLNKIDIKNCSNEIDGENTEFCDKDIILIDTDDMEAPRAENDIYTSRKNIYSKLIKNDNKTASIVIQAYNRLEKTKYCVECVLNYTKDIDYELVLIDNGSDDGTFEYFKSIQYKDKKIIRITKNVGAVFAHLKFISLEFKGKYLVLIPNDVYVTTNWLKNILICMESDSKIGWAIPMSSNVSNLQDPKLVFDSLDSMQEKAKIFNKSDPLKWEKRLRLINIVSIFKREVLDLVGKIDVGFFHDFSEDDYCIRMRRMGYKLVLCGDTFIHHDHDFTNLDSKNLLTYQKSLETGRKNFKDKYHGLDAWDDILNFEKNLIGMLEKPKKTSKYLKILGVDVKCGTPILEIENYLIRNGLNKMISNAFTTEAKYYLDLQTVCENYVWCDRIEHLNSHIDNINYDYIILGKNIDKYTNPFQVLDKLIKSGKQGAEILFKVSNNDNINNFLWKYRVGKSTEKPIFQNIILEDTIKYLDTIKLKNIKIKYEFYDINTEDIEKLKKLILEVESSDNLEKILQKIMIKEYLIYIEK